MTFWKNTIWYLALLVLSLIALAAAILPDKRPARVFGFFLVSFGVTLVVEQFLLFYTRAYYYYPLILTKAEFRYDDEAMGNLFSQISVSATLTMAVTRKIRRVWYFILAGVFGLIEEVFLELGIYTHNWYQTWITVAMLPIAFFTMELMYRWLLDGLPPFLYYSYMMLALFVPSLVFSWPLMLLSFLDFNTAFLGDSMASRYTVGVSLYMLAGPAAMIIVLSRLRKHWKILAGAVDIAASTALKYLGLVQTAFLPFLLFLLVQLGYFCLALPWIDRLMGHPMRRSDVLLSE